MLKLFLGNDEPTSYEVASWLIGVAFKEERRMGLP